MRRPSRTKDPTGRGPAVRRGGDRSIRMVATRATVRKSVVASVSATAAEVAKTCPNATAITHAAGLRAWRPNQRDASAAVSTTDRVPSTTLNEAAAVEIENHPVLSMTH